MIKFKGKQYFIDYKRIFSLISFIFGLGIVYAFVEKPQNMAFIKYTQLIISNTGVIDWIIISVIVFAIIKANIWEDKK